jgi:hypothetical protein
VSTVDYLTYIDQTTLKEFQWSEDAIGHLVGSAERRRVSQINEASEDTVDRVDTFRAAPIAATGIRTNCPICRNMIRRASPLKEDELRLFTRIGIAACIICKNAG